MQILDFSESVEWDRFGAISTQVGTVAEVVPPPKNDQDLNRTAPLEAVVPSPKIVVPQTNSVLSPAWASDSGKDQYGHYADLQVKGVVTQRFRFIEAGTFWMGSPASEPERDDENRHQVTLSKPFWLADTACTQALWLEVMGSNPANFNSNLDNPLEQVSWEDTQEFIQTLNSMQSNVNAQLPSEAQWEHACRAGTNSPFSFGEMISPEQVNYNGKYPYSNGKVGEYREQTVPVKSLPANQWGLYEMHGNVWEWCQDKYKEDLGTEFCTDPLHETGDSRVLRGGSWARHGGYCRSAYRIRRDPSLAYYGLGFRLSLVN